MSTWGTSISWRVSFFGAYNTWNLQTLQFSAAAVREFSGKDQDHCGFLEQVLAQAGGLLGNVH